MWIYISRRIEAGGKMTTERRFERFYNVLTFASMYFVAASFVVPIFITFGVAFLPLGAAFVLLLMLCGYAFQSLLCRITKFERKKNDSAYESTVKYFNFGRAFPIISIGIITVLFGTKLFQSLYLKLAQSNHNILYDSNSLVPFAAAFLIAFLLIFGSVIWFFPSSGQTEMTLVATKPAA